MAYWRLFYHLVWTTYERMPFIDAETERIVRGTLHSKAKDLRIFIHKSGMVEDHVHTVVSIPPTLAIADAVSQLKGASSHAANHLCAQPSRRFKWQDGYGVLSLGERSLPTVMVYVRTQKEHHAQGTTKAVFEHVAPRVSEGERRS